MLLSASIRNINSQKEPHIYLDNCWHTPPLERGLVGVDMKLTPPQMDRYSRQILLQGIGGIGQARLLNATVVLLGAGGLGSPVALYLAAAGVGHLVIADHDRVELSNLQRQILHNHHSLNQLKTESAAHNLRALNPDIKVTQFSEQVTEHNVQAFVQQGDLVIDGSDTFKMRYLLNRTCFHAGKILISAAVLGFEGQISTFRHGITPSSPCYQCLYPHIPESTLQPTCQTAGVLGALAGIIGSWQAAEAIKELLEIGESLDGSLLLINVLHGVVQRIRISKDPECPLCAINAVEPRS